MRKVITILAPILVLGLTVGSVTLLNSLKPEPEKNEPEERPVSAFVARAKRMDVTPTVVTQGAVQARREIDLVPQVGGRIVEISEAFEQGGRFEKGDLLFQIEKADYELAVIRARSRVAEAEQNLTREQAEAAMARRDWEELGEGEATPLTLREPQLAQRRASLAAAKADLEEAELNLRRTSIVAPFTGRVREKRADIGQVVNSANVLGRIFSTEIVQINLPLTDRELGMLSLPIGYMAEPDNGPVVHLSAVVAGQRRKWVGRIARADSAIDPQTRVLTVTCEVNDPYGEGSDNGVPLAVGLFVTAEIPGEPVTDVLVVPRTALRSADTVFVVRPDDEGVDRLEIRTVDVVFTETTRVVIASGIKEGERVITSAVEGAARGLKIRALDSEAPENREAARLSAGDTPDEQAEDQP